MKKSVLFFPLLFTCLFLAACSTLWERDNTPPPSPLVQFTPKIKPRQLWDTRINFGLLHEDIKFKPIIAGNDIIIANQTGTITGLNKTTGRIQWTTDVKASISGGVAADDQLIVVSTKNGNVIALSRADRRQLWKASMNSEILAAPTLSQNVVIVKSIDGKVAAFGSTTGQLLWRHQEIEPNLILRGASTPQLAPGALIVGYASGRVEKLALRDGHTMWSQTITLPEGAFAIQRMIDIDADPVVLNNQVFAASYQGRIAGLNLGSGRIFWDHEISSYAGIAADEARVYVSDAKSHIWAFDQRNGRIVWKQTQLEARKITGPVLVGPYVVVGDAEGVLHWLNTEDGNFAGRVQVSGTPILTKPAVDNKTVYAITKDGYLTAYLVN
jgi:outer membrane protein assembly factor BamB